MSAAREHIGIKMLKNGPTEEKRGQSSVPGAWGGVLGGKRLRVHYVGNMSTSTIRKLAEGT